MKCNVIHLADYEDVARKLLSENPTKRIFALYGEMGAGKTTFIQAICRTMEVEDIVSSPTFSIVNVYNSREHHEIYHFDFYRIKSIEEAFDIGYEDYFYSGNYCFIEWPGIIESLLPDEVKKVFITADIKSGPREITF